MTRDDEALLLALSRISKDSGAFALGVLETLPPMVPSNPPRLRRGAPCRQGYAVTGDGDVR